MKKLFMLAFANIRKSKGHTMSLFIIFLISALLLNAGLLIFFNFGGFFEKITKELKTSDVFYIIPQHLYNDQVEDFIKNNDNVIDMQKEQILWATGTTKVNDETGEKVYTLNDAENKRDISKWKFIGKHLDPEDMSIYIPYILHLKSGYDINDKFDLYLQDRKLSFTIKGFIEDAYFSSTETGMLGLYLPHDTYEKVNKELGGDSHAELIFVNLAQNNKELEKGMNRLMNQDQGATSVSADFTSSVFSLDRAILKLSRVMMASMVAIMVVAFAIIIVAVCLIVVRFRIGNSIEDDMTKIGSLKAVGYTSSQIIASIVIQFALIAIAGCIAGIFLSYLATPALSDVFAQQSGLKWVQGFDGAISGTALLSILLFIILVAYLAARRIIRLNPIVALRGGIITHSFRKNHLPLDKSRGSLPVVLAFKSILQNKRQSLMIAVILIAVSFAGTFSVGMFYNTSVDTKAFLETPGVELSNAAVILKPDTDNTELIEAIRNMSEVRKVQFIDDVRTNIDGNEILTYVMEDFARKETDTVYEGRYPLHSNEIVLAGYLADVIGKKVGDSVTVSVGDTNVKYIITGLSNGANYGGMNTSLRLDGMRKLNPEFKQQSLQIYLKTGVDAGDFVDKLEKQSGDSFLAVSNLDREVELGAGVYIKIVSKVGIIILAFTVLVVVLVLYFVINSTVTRRKRELGIQKANGFTTLQLMNQLSLGFLPPATIGVILGCILGATQTNTIMSVAQHSMGVMKSNFIVMPSWIIMFGAMLIIISYTASMIITSRIRRISAYSLVSE